MRKSVYNFEKIVLFILSHGVMDVNLTVYLKKQIYYGVYKDNWKENDFIHTVRRAKWSQVVILCLEKHIPARSSKMLKTSRPKDDMKIKKLKSFEVSKITKINRWKFGEKSVKVCMCSVAWGAQITHIKFSDKS